MSKKFFESRDFKTKQREWYSKLKDEGFKDLESGKKKDSFIGKNDLTNKNIDLRDNNECLRELNQKILMSFRFREEIRNLFSVIPDNIFLKWSHEKLKNELRDRHLKMYIQLVIFEFHTEGYSVSKILDWLRQNSTFNYSRSGIKLVIRRIKKDFERLP